MKLECNIDAQGSRVRGTVGTLILVLAVLLALAAWLTGWNWLWWPTAGCTVAANVMLFQAANSWCAIRAMGGKTGI